MIDISVFDQNFIKLKVYLALKYSFLSNIQFSKRFDLYFCILARPIHKIVLRKMENNYASTLCANAISYVF